MPIAAHSRRRLLLLAIAVALAAAAALLVRLDEPRSAEPMAPAPPAPPAAAASPIASATGIRVVGMREKVFDWSRDACTRSNVPDLPVRAFRDYRGRVQLLLPDFDNFRMIGPSLGRLSVDCAPVLRSGNQRAARRYGDREWLGSVYTRNGRRIWALVHDEYHGHRHRGRCPSGRYKSCWYNAITLARSDDGGRSYRRVGPRHLVASAPYRYRPDMGTTGVFTPSNIVRMAGAYYAMVRVRNPGGARGTCLMRTRRLSDPRGWRAWDGTRFGGVFRDPYRTTGRRESPCAPIANAEISEMAESLTYNTALDRWLLVGIADPSPASIGPKLTGVYFSTSQDLVHWTPRRLLLPGSRKQTYRCGDRPPIAYPSLIDPGSRSRTFATTGRRPFLYFTQFNYRNCRQTPDRDLIRRQVEILPP